jgi:hypothetical protein
MPAPELQVKPSSRVFGHYRQAGRSSLREGFMTGRHPDSLEPALPEDGTWAQLANTGRNRRLGWVAVPGRGKLFTAGTLRMTAQTTVITIPSGAVRVEILGY